MNSTEHLTSKRFIGMQSFIRFCLYIIFSAMQMAYGQLRVSEVTVEGKENPIGVQTLVPQFSWKLLSNANGTYQKGYRIQVFQETTNQHERAVWDSEWVSSEKSLYIPYDGASLQPGTSYRFHIAVKDQHGNLAEKENNYFHTGLLKEEDWGNAKWIAKEQLPDSLINPLPLSSSKLRLENQYELPVFRKSFKVTKKLRSAFAYISGLGHFELLLNGAAVDDAFLQPGWTKYDKEAFYVVYDLTNRIHQGDNVFGVLLGNGFYYVPPIKGRYQKHKVAFGLPKLKMKLILRYEDGSSEVIDSNQSWKTHRSPITFSSIYGGEDVDAQILPENWATNTYNDDSWSKALQVEGPSLIAQEIHPTKVMQSFKPLTEKVIDEETRLYDFGQNASGIINIRMKANKGDTIRIYPAELLKDGRITQKHTGSPHYYQYIFADGKEVSWSPKFSYYGFRFAEVELMPKSGSSVQILGIQADHIRNSTAQSGTFTSSDTLFNQIHNLINWGIKSNMVSVFTDCPHREKLGWLEQLHLMGPSVQYNFDAKLLFKKALRDMRNSQTTSGLVPEIAPEYVQFDWGGDMFRDSPEWGSSAIILPWYAYQWYGDISFLHDNYDMMKRYLQYLQGKAKDHILFQGLSDWYDIGPERPGVSQLTPKGITATSIYYYDLGIMAKIAKLLGKENDVNTYTIFQNKVGESFNKHFFDPKTAKYATGSQTSQAMPLYLGLVSPENKEKVLENLIQDIYSKDTSFTSGDVGHRYLIQVLSDHGYDQLIYDMHKDDTRPGYGYQIRKGATAITESWAALPNVSNNHFMLGHLMEWFHSGLGGIKQAPESVGFQHVWIAPKLLDRKMDVQVQYETPYGPVEVDRKTSISGQILTIQIPVGARATVELPKANHWKVLGDGAQPIKDAANPLSHYWQLPSGKYEFQHEVID
ncbi:family 78 glycoside hydrolase catalytic domain [Sphingobacterium lactis]|uniref:family 78 glycoside hydrolase catalytic domain n=1 Tax=Sphingobacterium lactis TaxID=797291 RepID=UPI003DA614CE